VGEYHGRLKATIATDKGHVSEGADRVAEVVRPLVEGLAEAKNTLESLKNDQGQWVINKDTINEQAATEQTHHEGVKSENNEAIDFIDAQIVALQTKRAVHVARNANEDERYGETQRETATAQNMMEGGSAATEVAVATTEAKIASLALTIDTVKAFGHVSSELVKERQEQREGELLESQEQVVALSALALDVAAASRQRNENRIKRCDGETAKLVAEFEDAAASGLDAEDVASNVAKRRALSAKKEASENRRTQLAVHEAAFISSKWAEDDESMEPVEAGLGFLDEACAATGRPNPWCEIEARYKSKNEKLWGRMQQAMKTSMLGYFLGDK